MKMHKFAIAAATVGFLMSSTTAIAQNRDMRPTTKAAQMDRTKVSARSAKIQKEGRVIKVDGRMVTAVDNDGNTYQVELAPRDPTPEIGAKIKITIKIRIGRKLTITIEVEF